MATVAPAPAMARRPRITSPVAGSVYALDPDIPPDRQRLAVLTSGDTSTHRLMLDARDIGVPGETMIVTPPGRHRLSLIDLSGRIVDRIVFTVK